MLRPIAYVTRAPDNAGAGKLNGGHAIADYLGTVVDRLEVVYVPQMAARSDGAFPEYADTLTYGWLAAQDWGRFDKILYGEHGFAPFFRLAGIKATLLVHMTWLAPDGTAHGLLNFARMADEVICPTPWTHGLYSSLGVKAVCLPYPVPETLFYPEPKNLDAVWVGRNDSMKRLDILLDAAPRIAGKIDAFVSGEPPTDTVRFPSLVNDNVRMHVGEDAHSAIRQAEVLVATSTYETYATVMVEAGLSGCHVVARDIPGYWHGRPYITLVDGDSPKKWAEAVNWCLSHRKPDAEPFWHQFASHHVRESWSKYILS